MDEQVSFSYQTKVGDMFRFLMYYNYIGIKGVINLVLSFGALALFVTGAGKNPFNNAMLILVALLFTVISPVMLYYKAAKQVKLSPMFLKPIDYTIDSEGIKVFQDGETGKLSWSEMVKVKETAKDFYFYTSLTRAHIVPKEAIKDQLDTLRRVIRSHGTDTIISIKK